MNDTLLQWDAGQLAEDERLLFTGRYPKGEKGLLCWTGSSLVIKAALSEWSADIRADWNVHTPYMAVLMDRVPVARFALQKGLHRYALVTGLDDTVTHEFALVRDTQPMTGEPELLVRVEGMSLAGELFRPDEKHTLEFIGDSLTTGEGAVGPKDGMEWRSVFLSGMGSWAQEVCRELDVRGEWVSQSGWGIYTSWDNNPDAVLTRIYESAAAHSPWADIRHDFAAHPVRAVVINLGTNDWNAMKEMPDGDRPERLGHIYDAARALLVQIHRCRPETPILVTYGMCGKELSDVLRAAAEKDTEASASPVAYLELPACPDEDIGSRFHPGPAHQARCGRLVAQKLREMGV